jgi:hypothetical protein
VATPKSGSASDKAPAIASAGTDLITTSRRDKVSDIKNSHVKADCFRKAAKIDSGCHRELEIMLNCQRLCNPKNQHH